MDDSQLAVVHYPHPTLRHESKPIKRVDGELARTIQDMLRLMYASGGIGLAANQVDLPLRLFVANLGAAPDEGEEMVFLNPVITRPKGTEESEEGCLSFPELYGPVKRPKQVTVNAYNLKGEEIKVELTGMLARVVQHETDHLDGVLFTDRMSATAKAQVQPMLEEFELAFANRRRTGEIPNDEELATRLAQWEERYC